jgi:transposase-like protein
MLHRWVVRFTPLLIDAERQCRHAVGRRWFVDEIYVRLPAFGATCTVPSTDTAR